MDVLPKAIDKILHKCCLYDKRTEVMCSRANGDLLFSWSTWATALRQVSYGVYHVSPAVSDCLLVFTLRLQLQYRT